MNGVCVPTPRQITHLLRWAPGDAIRIPLPSRWPVLHKGLRGLYSVPPITALDHQGAANGDHEQNKSHVRDGCTSGREFDDQDDRQPSSDHKATPAKDLLLPGSFPQPPFSRSANLRKPVPIRAVLDDEQSNDHRTQGDRSQNTHKARLRRGGARPRPRDEELVLDEWQSPVVVGGDPSDRSREGGRSPV